MGSLGIKEIDKSLWQVEKLEECKTNTQKDYVLRL